MKKEKKSIEEQVAELTEEQKDKIVKVGKWGTVAFLVTILPLLLFFLLVSFSIMLMPGMATNTPFLIGWIVLGALSFVAIIAYLIVIKAICPYYSDKKCNYIQKCRKEQKKK